jgi:hypothetical protein
MAILQRLRVPGFEQWGTLQGSTGETGMTGTTGVGQSLRPPAAAVRVAQQAYLTCDRLLSGRLGRLVEGVVGTLVGEQGAALAGLVGSAKAAGGRAASKEFASLEEGGPATKELAIEAVEATDKEWETRCFRLIVKNSFIEFAEDGPARPLGHQRKARSCDDLQSFFGRYSEECMIVDVGICRRDAVPTTPTMSDDAPRQDPAQMAGESVVAAAYRPSVLRPPPGLAAADELWSAGDQGGRGGFLADPVPGGDPKAAGDEPSVVLAGDGPHSTTVLLRNVPTDYTRDGLLDMLESAGFVATSNFVYMPLDFRRGKGLGYALVGFERQPEAQQLLDGLQGRHFPDVRQGSDQGPPCEASWSEPQHSLAEHVERYRNSPVMHPSMPDEYKPVLFMDGRRVDFPAPTKPIRAPRIRHLKEQKSPAEGGEEAANATAEDLQAQSGMGEPRA